MRIELDVDRYDRHGRLLAYVFTEGDSTETLTFANAELLRVGMARVMMRPPNLQYADFFRRLEREAKSNRLGIWEKGEMQ